MSAAGTLRAQSPTESILLIGDTANSQLVTNVNRMPCLSGFDSYTQQLVLGTELNGEAMITGIDLYCGTPSSTGRPGCTIYLANTYVQQMGSSLVPFSPQFKQVAVTSLACTTGWNHYAFDTAFHYNGLGNLIVAVDCPWGTGGNFYCSQNGTVLACFTRNRLSSVTATTAVSGSTMRNIMRLHTLPVSAPVATCPAPTLWVDSIGATATKVRWSPGYQDTLWTVDCITDGDTAWHTSGPLWGDTSYTITGLNPNSHYTVRLTAFCTDTFTNVDKHLFTNCTPTALPYAEGFEGIWSVPSCWRTVIGWNNTHPAIVSGGSFGANRSHSGDHGLQLNGGTVILPAFDAPVDSLELSLWTRNGQAATNLTLNVGVVTDPLDITTFVPIDTVVLLNSGEWTPAVVRLDSYAGTYGLIAIKCGSSGTYIYLDDIEVHRAMPCQTILNVSIDQIVDTAAVVHWADSDAVYYEVAYGPSGFTIDSTYIVTDIRTDSLFLGGLLPYTLYDVYVRSYCGSYNTNWSLVRQFRTLCSPLDTLPYVEDFESYPSSSSPLDIPCWRGTTDMNTYIVTPSGGETAHSGLRAMRFVYDMYTSTTTKIILPHVDTAAYDMASLQLSFWAANALDTYNRYDDARIVVGVMSDPTADSTFVPIDTVDIIGGEWQRYDIPLNGYRGDGAYICMRECPGIGTHGNSWALVDDVTIGVANGCPSVTGMRTAGLTATSVTVRWAGEDTAARYQVFLDTSLSALPTGSSWLTEPCYTFGGLDTGTTYYCWVRTLCPKGDTSAWEGPLAVRSSTWNMRANRNDTLTMCGVSIYDDGGANGDFSRQTSTLVILPDMPGHLVTLSGRSHCGSSSEVTIYDGIGTSGPVLWTTGLNSYYQVTFGPVRSTTGPLTLHFNGSTAFYTYEGFEMNAHCIPDTCIIHNLQLDPAVPPSDTAVALTWQCNGASLYEVEYGPVGFTPGTGTADTTTANQYTIAGLRSLDRREVRVRSICGAGDTGEWVSAIFTTALCPDATMRDNCDSLYYPSGNPSLPIGFNGSPYSYVQTLIDSADLAGLEGGITALAFQPFNNIAADHQGRISVYLANVPDTAFTSGPIVPDAGHRFVRVIDSADFSHPGTTEWQLHSFDRPFMWDGHQNLLVAVLRRDGGSGERAEYASHYTYSDVVNNVYRSYILTGWGDIDIDSARNVSPNYSGYGSPYRGHIRLYTNTCALPLCPVPTIDSVTADHESITVSWSGTGESYQIACDMNWPATVYPASTPLPATGGSHTFTGLMPNTQYTISLRQSCTADSLGHSAWTYATITTADYDCPAPQGFTVDSVDYTSATLNWEPAGSDSLYQLLLWQEGYRAVSHTALGRSLRVQDLHAGTTYRATLRAFCGTNSQIAGPYGDTIQFTTSSCSTPTGLSATNVTASTITLTWDADPAEHGYRLEYGPAPLVPGMGTVVTPSGTSHTLTGLMPNTEYDIFLSTLCTDSVASDPAVLTLRTQQDVGITPTTHTPSGLQCILTPNPAKGRTLLTVTGWNPTEGNTLRVTVTDLAGRDLHTYNISPSQVLPIEGLVPGAYFVRIQGQTSHTVRKLIIEN
ncbi:MAG: fibronectin type III domain-containing protein [Bacteroidales bacterium]|nr:fibronectin type III domain-containing protein [Bacteroidales bacterium]